MEPGHGELVEFLRKVGDGVGEERIESYPSSDAALAALKDRFTTRDLVLVKGSRFMGLDAFARGVLA